MNVRCENLIFCRHAPITTKCEKRLIVRTSWYCGSGTQSYYNIKNMAPPLKNAHGKQGRSIPTRIVGAVYIVIQKVKSTDIYL